MVCDTLNGTVLVYAGTGGAPLATYGPLAAGQTPWASAIGDALANPAGTAPALVSADFGPVGPSRHPCDVVASHVSTETGAFTRHVTCSDPVAERRGRVLGLSRR